jgi:hypothetical protein
LARNQYVVEYQRARRQSVSARVADSTRQRQVARLSQKWIKQMFPEVYNEIKKQAQVAATEAVKALEASHQKQDQDNQHDDDQDSLDGHTEPYNPTTQQGVRDD